MGRSRLELRYMEEEELLRVLVLIIINLIAKLAYGAESDEQWARGVVEHSTVIAVENFKNMMQMPGFDKEVRDLVLAPRPTLQIFVSHSMSKESLKSYVKEAHRYNGVLVFRGLPAGSFRKITDLVMDISDERHPIAIQIDDEAFKQFGITLVPAIVFTIPASIFSEQTVKEKFDKVTGHITIKAALEIFAAQGDLSVNAKERLK